MNSYCAAYHAYGIRYSIAATFTAADDAEATAIRDRDYPGAYLCRCVGSHYGVSI